MKLRLLPILILAAVLTLSVRVSDVWEALPQILGAGPSPAAAQEGGAGQSGALDLEVAAGDQFEFQPWEITPAAADNGAEDSEDMLRDPYEMTDEEIDLLQKLSVRRREINRRYREVEAREALLTAAENRIDQKISELEILRKKIEELMRQNDEQDEAQIRSLVKIYENMKPKDAAQIFEGLDMDVLLEVVDRMKERKIAPILAQLTPDRAKAITVELAQRRDLSMVGD